MFNSFPQPKPDSTGGLPSPLDWSAYQTVYNWTRTAISTAPASWSTFVNITGTGFLTFVQAFDASSYTGTNPDIKVTVDGTSYVFSGTNAAGASEIPSLITHPIYFKSSLKVEVYNRSATTDNMVCDYTYLLKTGNPNPNKQTQLISSTRAEYYHNTSAATPVDAAQITGSGYLSAIEFTGWYASAVAITSAIVTIDGSVIMPARTVFDTASPSNRVRFSGPIRFNSSLRVQHYTGNAGTLSTTRVFVVLD